MKQLDIGCGATLRPAPGHEVVGVDIHDYGIPEIRVADLAIERIPFNDNRFDLVTAHDFMEHIPPVLYVPKIKTKILTKKDVLKPPYILNNPGDKVVLSDQLEMVKRNCLIELFNEIYRVLKPGGEFYMVSPYYLSPDAFRDPTHVSFWTEHSAHYFSGDYVGMHDLYNHTSKFELLENRADRPAGRLYIRLKAIKPAEGPYLVGEYTGEVI